MRSPIRLSDGNNNASPLYAASSAFDASVRRIASITGAGSVASPLAPAISVRSISSCNAS